MFSTRAFLTMPSFQLPMFSVAGPRRMWY